MEGVATLVIGERRAVLTGRVAAVVALLIRHQDRINSARIGKVEVAFAQDSLVLTMQESLERVKLG